MFIRRHTPTMEGDAQIGEDWTDEESRVWVYTMALSRNSKTIASGSWDGKVKLWDVEAEEVVARWTGHTRIVS